MLDGSGVEGRRGFPPYSHAAMGVEGRGGFPPYSEPALTLQTRLLNLPDTASLLPALSPLSLSPSSASVYCPSGTGSRALDVRAGYYTVGGPTSNHTRAEQAVCEPGFYCKRGVKLVCPVGRFGATTVRALGHGERVRTSPSLRAVDHQ